MQIVHALPFSLLTNWRSVGCRPNQCPQKYLSRFPSLPASLSRQCYNGMMAAMDDAIGDITGAVRARAEMYNNSIIIFSTVRSSLPGGGPSQAK